MNLSIVIPVYNVKEYLVECVNSILNAQIHNYEIILVDDGSTDGSQLICDEFNNSYPKIIRVIHQKNSGLSAARNKGLEFAQGKYIFFMDSDDIVISDQFAKLVATAMESESEIIVGRAKYIYLDGTEIDKAYYCINDGFNDGQTYLEYILRHSNNNTFCAQFNIYKSEFLRKNNYRFYPNIIHEDELWTPTVFLGAKKVLVTSIYFYKHFQRKGSIMTSSKEKNKAKSLFFICTELERLYSGFPHNSVKYLRNRMAMLYLNAYALAPNMININMYNRLFPIKNACKKRTFQLAILYLISPKMYCTIKKSLK